MQEDILARQIEVLDARTHRTDRFAHAKHGTFRREIIVPIGERRGGEHIYHLLPYVGVNLFDEIEYRSERTCSTCGKPASKTSKATGLPACVECAEMFSFARNEKFANLTETCWIRIENDEQYTYNGREWTKVETDSAESD